MTTPLINIELEEGTDYNLQITYTNPSTGLPVDITDYTADLIIDRSMEESGSVIYLSSGTGQIVITGTAGILSITIPQESTEGFGQFLGFYNLYITTIVEGVRTKISKGFFTVSPSVK